MTEQTPKPSARHNQPASRFELTVDGKTAILDYTLKDSTLTFSHTLVPTELEGRGLGSLLALAGLEFARENAFKVVPACWFMAGYIERHPEFQNLLKG